MPDCLRIQADLVLASEHRLLCPGQVVCRHGHIVEVTSDTTNRPDITLDGRAILPGLVNPHTHLEFSDLAQPVPPGASFPEWIGSVLALRRSRSDGRSAEDRLFSAIQAGLVESFESGVVFVADIVTPPWSYALFSQLRSEAALAGTCELESNPLARLHLASPTSYPELLPCIEQLGLTESRRQELVRWCDSVLEKEQIADSQAWRPAALSPHSPYSVQASHFEQLCDQARQTNRLLAMHVAESPAEREWLDHGTGPFQQLFQRMNIVPPPKPPNLNDWIKRLASVERSLLIHGNYLRADEIETLSSVRDRVSVVYCPRTHQHFHHQPYPLTALHQAGVHVVIGTDSRSTNPDLKLWLDMQTAIEAHPNWAPSLAFDAITCEAAKALGVDDEYGSIASGRKAAMAVLPVPNRKIESVDDLIEHWLELKVVPRPLQLEVKE